LRDNCSDLINQKIIAMKNIVLTLTFLIGTSAAFAQVTERDRSMKDILKDCQSLIDDIENRNEEIVRMEFDIVKDKKETFRTLTDSYTYGITAVGDYRITKIGIELYSEDYTDSNTWTLVKVENADKYFASITIKPSATKRYKIVVKALKFDEDYTGGHYGLIVYHE